jgi:hypothetical protein
MRLIAGPWVDNLRSREDQLMSDLVRPAFRESRDEAIFVMFGQLHASLHNTQVSARQLQVCAEC